MKIAAVAAASAISCALLHRTEKAIGLALVLAVCTVTLLSLRELLLPVSVVLQQLAVLTQINHEYLIPVLKTAAICIVTQMAAAVCTDAGESLLAKLTEFCGSIAALYVTLPLLQNVMLLVQELMGG